MTSSITVAPPSALTTLAPGTKCMAGEPMKPATKSSGGASFSVSDMQEAGIDLFQRTEGGVRPVPHHTCHLSSKTFRPMKTVQRREQVLFLLIGCSSDCFAVWRRQLLRSPEMCSANKDEVKRMKFQGSSGVFRHSPDPPSSVDPPRAAHRRHLGDGVPRTASNTSQYSGSAWGSQPPEGGMFLSCCFAFLAGCCRVTRKARSTPMMRHSYRERDYA